jgi:hypothetical protein
MIIMILVRGWLVRHFGVREVADIACNGYLMSNFYGISFNLFISRSDENGEQDLNITEIMAQSR